jgi:hypothetical protein
MLGRALEQCLKSTEAASSDTLSNASWIVNGRRAPFPKQNFHIIIYTVERELGGHTLEYPCRWD